MSKEYQIAFKAVQEFVYYVNADNESDAADKFHDLIQEPRWHRNRDVHEATDYPEAIDEEPIIDELAPDDDE